jgi:hypothetical protein
MQPQLIDIVKAPQLSSLTPADQNDSYDWMWETAQRDDNVGWCALDAIVRIWGDRDAQILLDGYVDGAHRDEV